MSNLPKKHYLQTNYILDRDGWAIHLSLNTRKASLISQWGLCSRYLSSRAVARQVLSAQMSLTSVFGMGTGGPSSQSTRTIWMAFNHRYIKSLAASNSIWIIAPLISAVKRKFKKLVTHTGFEPMLTAWEAAVLTTWPTGHGAPSGTRTRDPLIKSQLLYQLS